MDDLTINLANPGVGPAVAELGGWAQNMKLRFFVLIVLLGFTLACSRKPDMSRPYVVLADRFPLALADGRFDEAHALLADGQKKAMSTAVLKKEYEGMIAYSPRPSRHVEVIQTLHDWPDKKKDDVGWVYVAITGDSFSEAGAVVVFRRTQIVPRNGHGRQSTGHHDSCCVDATPA